MINVEVDFKALVGRYTENNEIIDSFWSELLKEYEAKNRHYHNLSHIAELIQFFNEFKESIQEKDVVLFAIFYHDIIYNVKKKDNEEKSAELAKQRMSELNIQSEIVSLVYDYIVATKSHELGNSDQDLAYFLDFDMAILGKNWDDYLKYTKKIRKEYSIYPNLLYKKGRKEALKRFLKTGQIYKTDIFYNLFEKQARENIQKEIDELL